MQGCLVRVTLGYVNRNLDCCKYVVQRAIALTTFPTLHFESHVLHVTRAESNILP